MSWRTVVISKNAKLDYQLGYLVVRNQDVVKIHISEIAVLIIETTSVALTVALSEISIKIWIPDASGIRLLQTRTKSSCGRRLTNKYTQ